LKKSFGTVAFHCVDIIRKDISLDAIPSGGSKAAHTVERLRAEARRAQRKEKDGGRVCSQRRGERREKRRTVERLRAEARRAQRKEKNVEGLLAETGRAQRKGKDGGRVCSQRRGERREKERTVEGFARRDAESAKKREERGRVCSQGRGREEKVISKQNRMHENEISGILVDIFVKVHSSHGPGLFESVYEELVCYELTKRGLKFKRQQAVPVTYEGIKLELGFRADIIVEDKVIVEIKSIEALAPVHHKQLLTYLRLADKRLGLLVNFNVDRVKDGIVRIVNKLDSAYSASLREN
jgi:GxxExxY protein